MKYLKTYEINIDKKRMPPKFKVGDSVYVSKNVLPFNNGWRGLKLDKSYIVQNVNDNQHKQYTYNLIGQLLTYSENSLMSEKEYKEEQLKKDSEKYNL
jgi:hypothetical protein